MYALPSILSLIIPLGLGLVGLFAAFLAHRGYATRATWILLVSAINYLVMLILMGASSFMLMAVLRTGSRSTAIGYELAMGILMALLVLSILAYSYGVLQIGIQWKFLSKETADLEKEAQQLAVQRDEV